MGTGTWIILGVVAVVILLIFWIIGAYNKLVKLRAHVKNAWAQIEVHLKRRFDLIPNLVSTVKGYATHESETLEKVIAARNKFATAPDLKSQMEASNELSGLLSRLMVLTENYPELKANTNFLQLQDDLKDTENKIAFTRQFYNDTAMKYNTAIQTFPTVIVAGLFNFKETPYFDAGQEAQTAPKVEF